jgi:hypothetical protein
MTMRLNRAAYEKMIAEDIAWLEQQPRTLERDHILVVLQHAVGYEYGATGSREKYESLKEMGILRMDDTVSTPTQRPHELFVRCSTEFVEMIQGKPSFPVTIQIEKVENGELFFVATRHECTPRRDDVTATEIEAIALQYDRECRGGIGRGDIDLELAQRLAAWFNALLAPAAAGR